MTADVEVGLRFRKLVADEKPLWEVVRHLTEDYWECRVVESWDYVGTLAVFDAREILAAVRIAEIFGGERSDG